MMLISRAMKNVACDAYETRLQRIWSGNRDCRHSLNVRTLSSAMALNDSTSKQFCDVQVQNMMKNQVPPIVRGLHIFSSFVHSLTITFRRLQMRVVGNEPSDGEPYDSYAEILIEKRGYTNDYHVTEVWNVNQVPNYAKPWTVS